MRTDGGGAAGRDEPERPHRWARPDHDDRAYRTSELPALLLLEPPPTATERDALPGLYGEACGGRRVLTDVVRFGLVGSPVVGRNPGASRCAGVCGTHLLEVQAREPHGGALAIYRPDKALRRSRIETMPIASPLATTNR